MSHGTLKPAICSYMNVCLSLEPKTKSSILLRKEVTGASAVPRLVEEVVCQGNEKDNFPNAAPQGLLKPQFSIQSLISGTKSGIYNFLCTLNKEK